VSVWCLRDNGSKPCRRQLSGWGRWVSRSVLGTYRGGQASGRYSLLGAGRCPMPAPSTAPRTTGLLLPRSRLTWRARIN
jgi:hypothetical protein